MEKNKLKIKVTIGICLTNCEDEVSKIVNRINEQDFPSENLEAIFVDDGSEDNTLFKIFKFASNLNPSYQIFHHKWRGLGYSRNVVLNNAQGDYIVWIDDGTLISKDYIKEHVSFLELHPNVGIVKGVIGVDNSPNLLVALENAVLLAFSYKHGGKFTNKLPGTGGSVYRVKAAKQVGGFDERLQGATEDMDIAHRIYSAGWKIFRTKLTYQTIFNGKFIDIWNKNYWYGYGSHPTLHKHKELSEILYKSTPLAGFLEGLLGSPIAYKVTHKKVVFMLPIYFAIKRTAFCLGFIKSHLDAYGH